MLDDFLHDFAALLAVHAMHSDVERHCRYEESQFHAWHMPILDAYAAADDKQDADPETFLHVPSTRTILCAHA